MLNSSKLYRPIDVDGTICEAISADDLYEHYSSMELDCAPYAQLDGGPYYFLARVGGMSPINFRSLDEALFSILDQARFKGFNSQEEKIFEEFSETISLFLKTNPVQASSLVEKHKVFATDDEENPFNTSPTAVKCYLTATEEQTKRFLEDLINIADKELTDKLFKFCCHWLLDYKKTVGIERRAQRSHIHFSTHREPDNSQATQKLFTNMDWLEAQYAYIVTTFEDLEKVKSALSKTRGSRSAALPYGHNMSRLEPR